MSSQVQGSQAADGMVAVTYCRDCDEIKCFLCADATMFGVTVCDRLLQQYVMHYEYDVTNIKIFRERRRANHFTSTHKYCKSIEWYAVFVCIASIQRSKTTSSLRQTFASAIVCTVHPLDAQRKRLSSILSTPGITHTRKE